MFKKHETCVKTTYICSVKRTKNNKQTRKQETESEHFKGREGKHF